MASASAKIPPGHARQIRLAGMAMSTNVTLAQTLGGRLTGNPPSPGSIDSNLLSGQAIAVPVKSEPSLVPAHSF